MHNFEIVTQRLFAEMEKGSIPWQGFSVSSASVNAITDKQYSGGNQMILQMTQSIDGFKTPFWAGYSQWASIGVNVNKGQTGTRILRPTIIKDKDTDKAKLCGMKCEVVFNACQTTFDVSSFKGNKASDLTSIASADNIVNGMPQRPEINHTSPNRAFYSPLTDRVTMPTSVTCDSEQYYSILFHELAHSTGHSSRLKRPSLEKIQGFGTHEYSKEELVAEITAAILCNESGILDSTLTNSAAYCQSWFKVLKNDPKFLYSASGDAFKAASFILGKV